MTAIGKDFVREARQLDCRLDQLVVSTRAAGQSGGLMVGYSRPISAGNLRAALFDWRGKYPDIELDGIEAPLGGSGASWVFGRQSPLRRDQISVWLLPSSASTRLA